MAGVTATDEETPVYDSVETERVEGIPDIAIPVPRHPDIYRELVGEWGHDVLAEIRSADSLPTRSAHPDR